MLAQFGKLALMRLRNAQEEAINFIHNSDKRIIVISGPTGVGKTAIGLEAVSPSMFYLCNSKELQDQIQRDYPNEIVTLKGQSNYPCYHDLCENAEECVLQGRRHVECHYLKARNIAFKAPRAVLNFHYFLSSANYAGKPWEHISKKNQSAASRSQPDLVRSIVIDECDMMELVLSEFVSFKIRLKTLGMLEIFSLPRKRTKIEAFVEWSESIIPKLKRKLDILNEDIKPITEKVMNHCPIDKEDRKTLRIHRSVSSVHQKLKFLSNQNLSENWLYQLTEKEITVEPVWLNYNITNEFLFQHGKQFICMSATAPPKPIFCGLFGVPPDEVDYLELPSPFDPNRCPIFFTGNYSLTHKNNPETKKIISTIESVLAKESGRGIIHCVSYKLSQLIEDNLRDRRLLFHRPSTSNIEGDGFRKSHVFKKFLQTPGAVLVSPTSTRGIDLPDDLCRFIHILKVPFLDLSSRKINARVYGSGKFGRMWYLFDAAQTIIQAAGRAMRHEKDWCHVYITDREAERLFLQSANLFSKSFREALRFE